MALAIFLVAVAACGPGRDSPPTLPPSPTPDELARKERIAQRALDAYQAAVGGKPLPSGVSPELREEIVSQINPSGRIRTVVWEPERPVVWEQVPPPPGYDPESASVMRATFRGGRGVTDDPEAFGGPTRIPYDLAGLTFEVLLERRGGAWVATDVVENGRVDGT
jgi:hypothetical protein